MELTGLVPILKRWATVIVVATGMAVVVGLVLGSNAQKTYEARAQLLVGPLSTDSNTMRASGDLAQTYAELATSDNVLRTVAEDVDVPRSELATGVRATANSATRFLVIRARSHDAKTAAEVADSVSSQLMTLGGTDPVRPEGQLRVIDAASTPGSPVSPRLDLIVPLAAIAGLLGSVTLVLLFEFVGDTAESGEKVEAAAGIPALAIKRRRAQPPAIPEGRRADPIRLLATQAELATPVLRCILVTGVARQDGSASLALELADIWGERRRRVLVLDAGSGELATLTGAAGTEGLSDWLAFGGDRPVATRRSPTVEVVSDGRLPGTEALDIATIRRSVEFLLEDDDLLVVHAPPATLSAATLAWAQVADVALLVVRRFQSRRSSVEEAAGNLRLVGATLPFAVLLDLPRQPWRRAGRPGPSPSRPPSNGPDQQSGAPENDEIDELAEAAVPTTATNGTRPPATTGVKRSRAAARAARPAGVRP